MVWWLTLSVLVLAACAAPKAGPAPSSPMAGENWEVRDLTLQRYSDEVKWRYLLRLRDVSGTGLRLTKFSRGIHSATIDLKIEPNGMLEIPCWEAVFRRTGAQWSNFDVEVKKTFSGQDGLGRPVTFTVDLAFDPRDPPERTRLLEFAKFTDRYFSPIPQPHFCETVPNGINVVNRTQAQRIYFLVGTDLTYLREGTRLRTRWIGPSGDEVKVIDSIVRELGQISGVFLYESATHSIPRELFYERPGEWKVEVIVNDQYQGVYTIQVI